MLDFKPFCVHQETVGQIQGIDWDLVHLVEQYQASREAQRLSQPFVTEALGFFLPSRAGCCVLQL